MEHRKGALSIGEFLIGGNKMNLDDVKKQAENVLNEAKEKVEELKDSPVVDQVMDKAKEVAKEVQNSDIVDKVKEKVDELKDSDLVDKVTDNAKEMEKKVQNSDIQDTIVVIPSLPDIVTHNDLGERISGQSQWPVFCYCLFLIFHCKS